jgi:RHS repeat-associated protein
VLDTDERLITRLKVARLLDADGNQARYAYDDAAATVTVTFSDAAGNTRTIAYTYIEDTLDTRRRYVTEETITVSQGFSGTQLVENQWRYSADGRFRVEAIVDAVGGETQFAYNDFNQITQRVDAAGHVRNFSYDVRGGPTAADPNRYDLIKVSETNIDGAGTSFSVQSQTSFGRYDTTTSADAQDTAQSTHRPATQTNELGAVWRFAYDDVANFLPLRPTRTTDPLGNAVTSAYDETGSLLRQTDAEGATWERTYNSQGQVVALRDPNGFKRTWVYDASSRWLTAVTDARGASPGDPVHSITYDYDAAGRRTQDTDPVGAILEYTYLANRRLGSLTRQDQVPRTTAFAYDASGALTQIRDARGHATFFNIDEAGRIYQSYRDDPAHPSLRVSFDATGRPTEITDRNGQITAYGYDAVGRVRSIREPDWPAGAPVQPGKQIAIAYDELGRRLRVSDSELPRDRSYAYDAAGNLTAVTDPFGPSLQYAYDARAALVSVTDGTGVVDVSFARDATAHLIGVTDSAWQDPARRFDFVRQEGALVDDLYRIESESGLITRFAYDANRQLTQATTRQAAATIATYGYQYRNDTLLGRATGDHAGDYDYDPIKRLTRETDVGVRSAYDAAGNRSWRAAQAPPAGQANDYDADNRLLHTPADDTTYSYDDNGNLLRRAPTNGETTSYEYDGANRLRHVTRGQLTIAYRYDVDGRLLEREQSATSGTVRSRYLYANGAIIAELGANDDVRTLYTRADDGRLLRSRAIDRLDPAPSNDAHSLFYVHDGLGSVVRMLDWDGTPRLAVDYDAWGRGAGQGAAGSDLFRYREGLQDADSRLLCFGRRWYDPDLGRWLTPDPVLTEVVLARRAATSALAEIANLYLYVGANPLNLADPTGLGPWMDWFKASKPGKFLDAWIRGKEISWPSGQPKGTATEQVQRKAPASNKDQAGDDPGADPEEAAEPGAGEGSHSPSSERTYQRLQDENARSAGGWGLGVIVATLAVATWEGVKWGGAAILVPETGGASFAVAGALP